MSATALAKQTPVETLPLEGRIRRRAYELYLQRRNQAGSKIEDWLPAEADILRAERDASCGRRVGSIAPYRRPAFLLIFH
jgi:hypothetical protein